MSRESVLYDAPGPRARRRTAIFSVVVAVGIVVGLYYLAYIPLQRRGQLTMEKWGPIVDPSNESFSPLWERMGEGWTATAKCAVLAIVFSFTAGTAIAILRSQLRVQRGRRFVDLNPALASVARTSMLVGRGVSRAWVEVFRGLPVFVTIIYSFYVLVALGFQFDDPMWYVVIGLTLYNSVVIGEILRSGMAGLPQGQREAASSIGLSPGQSLRLVQLPQSFRIMLPALISQAVVILKDTALGGLSVAFVEALRTARGIVEVLRNPLPMYLTIALQYMIVCYAVSKLAEYLDRRIRRGRKVPATKADRSQVVVAAELQ